MSQLTIEFSEPPAKSLSEVILNHINIPLLGGIFRRMEIAEEEIKKYQNLYPGKSDEIWESFSILKASQPMRDKAEYIYRKHVQELLERVASGEDTSAPTGPELLSYMSEMSLRAPLTHDAAAAYYRVASECFPNKDFGPEIRPTWEGGVQQFLNELKSKITVNR